MTYLPQVLCECGKYAISVSWLFQPTTTSDVGSDWRCSHIAYSLQFVAVSFICRHGAVGRQPWASDTRFDQGCLEKAFVPRSLQDSTKALTRFDVSGCTDLAATTQQQQQQHSAVSTASVTECGVS
mgnify:CR=1 FL=1